MKRVFKKALALIMVLMMVFSTMPLEATYAGVGREGGVANTIDNSDKNGAVKIASKDDEETSSTLTPQGGKGGVSSIMNKTYVFMNGTDEISRQTVSDGKTLYEPEAQFKEGYKFLGWFNGPDKFSEFGVQNNVTDETEVTLEAKFEQVSHVFFMSGIGAEARVIETREGKPGEEKKADAVYLEAGKNLVGWYTDKELAKPVESVILGADDIYLYPKFESGHWITFDSQGGTYIEPKFYLGNATSAAPTEPTRAGYTFKHWSIEENGNAYTFGILNSDVKLYAVWTPGTAEYTVIHWLENANDNKYSFKDSVEMTGTSGNDTKAVEKVYEGFTVQNIEQQVINGDGTTIVNVYYKRDVYSVKFFEYKKIKDGWISYFDEYDWVENEELRIEAKAGAYILNQWPAAPKGAGYSWASQDGNTWYQKMDVMEGNLSLYEKYEGSKYDVKKSHFVEIIEGENTTGLETETYKGKTYKLSRRDESKSDSKLKLRVEELTGFTYTNNVKAGASYEQDGNLLWLDLFYNRNKYDIKFMNIKEGTITVAKQYEAPITAADILVPERPSSIPEGYTFDGWYDNELFAGEKYTFPATMPAKGITVYAKWVAPEFEAIVHINVGDSTLETIIVPYGESINTNEENSKKFQAANEKVKNVSGKTFIGWSTLENEYKPFHPDAEIYQETHLYPYYISSDSFRVTYDIGSGSGVRPVDDLKYGDGAHAVARSKDEFNAPTGKVFLGWSTKENETKAEYQPNELVKITKDTTLFAVYGNIGYTVTYMLDGIQYETVETYEYGTEVKVKADPEKVGYTFSGWSTEDATIANGAFTMPAKNVVIRGSFEINNYTVIYMLDGVQYETVETYKYGTEVKVKADPEKVGYTFSGWSTEDATIEDGTFTMPAKNVVIRGSFEINNYTVTYMLDGVQYETVETYKYGTEVKVKADPEKVGYTFSGWSTEDATIEDGTFTMPAKNVVIRGSFEINNYTVTYMLDGVQYETVETYKYGTEVKVKADPEKVGYTFSGWSTEDATIEDGTFTMPAKNVVIRGSFEINNYTVTYMLDGVQYETVETYKYGTEVKVKADPEKVGYTFSGWSTEDATIEDGTFTMPAKNVVIRGSFEINNYTVTYMLDGVQYETVETYKYGTEVKVKADPEKVGYTFSGWSTEDATIEDGAFTMPAKNVVIRGSFEINNYTVTYMLDGVQYETVETYKYGTEVKVKADPEKVGYTFSGWSTEDATIEDGTFTMPAKNVVIRGSFEINNYTVTYMLDGVQYETVETYKYGTEVKVKADPEKVGYTFSGWSTEDATIEDGTFTMPAKNVVIRGSFEINNYTVTYMLDGVQYETVETYKYGTEVKVKADPEKVGYTFSGWSTEDVTIANGAFTMPAKNVVIRGSFEINNYTVTYMLDGVQYETVETYKYGTEVKVKADPEKVGYTFSGWSTEDATIEDGTFTMPAKNVVIRGSFEINNYTVTYMLDGVQYETVETYKYGTEVKVKADPEKVGYTFSGWSTEDATIEDGTFTMPAKNVVIRGSFEINNYTVTYMLDGVQYETVETYKYGTEVKVKADPEKVGYTFSGWSTEDATIANGAFTMPAKNVVVKGSFTEDYTQTKESSYTVEYYKRDSETEAFVLDGSAKVTDNIWVNADKMPVDRASINTTDKFGSDYFFVMTEPSTIPTMIADKGVIKVYYEKYSEEPGLHLYATGYEGIYDGKQHGLSGIKAYYVTTTSSAISTTSNAIGNKTLIIDLTNEIIITNLTDSTVADTEFSDVVNYKYKLKVSYNNDSKEKEVSLIIKPRRLTITAASAKKPYDGTKLTAPQWTVKLTGDSSANSSSGWNASYILGKDNKLTTSGLSMIVGGLVATNSTGFIVGPNGGVAEDQSLSVTVEGEIIEIGKEPNKIVAYTVKESTGREVTSNYEFKLVNGELEIYAEYETVIVEHIYSAKDLRINTVTEEGRTTETKDNQIVGKEFTATEALNFNGKTYVLNPGQKLTITVVKAGENKIVLNYTREFTSEEPVVPAEYETVTVEHIYSAKDLRTNTVTEEGRTTETKDNQIVGKEFTATEALNFNGKTYVLNPGQQLTITVVKAGENKIVLNYTREFTSEEPVVPTEPTEPENPAPIEPVVPTEPIEDEEIPGGEISEDPTPEEPVEEQPEEPIEDEEVPAGNLPDTGGVTAPIFYGLGALALASGLFVGRKKKENN